MIGNFNITNNIQSLMQIAIKSIYKFSDFDAEEQAWDSVVAWLTRLRLLEEFRLVTSFRVRRCYQMNRFDFSIWMELVGCFG